MRRLLVRLLLKLLPPQAVRRALDDLYLSSHPRSLPYDDNAGIPTG